ncbi:hypothetical protein Ancab_032712 [Ancistrocladus abbreviatus]
MIRKRDDTLNVDGSGSLENRNARGGDNGLSLEIATNCHPATLASPEAAPPIADLQLSGLSPHFQSRRLEAIISSSSLSLKHGLALWCPQSSSLAEVYNKPSLIACRSFHQSFTVNASSNFANENREYVIVGGGDAAGYAAKTLVEHGMADGKLCIVGKEVRFLLRICGIFIAAFD